MSTLEVWSSRGRDEVIRLTEHTYFVGSDPASSQIVLDDPTVSAMHAALDRIGSTWLVRDTGSRNGTHVGSVRVTGQHRLRDGDEIRVGRCRLRFLDSDSARRPRTEALAAPPDNLTRAERRVLVELCRPLMSHNVFQPPASVREIADRLCVGKNAVQAHLVNLYDKFELFEGEGGNRRVALANEAIQRGAVTQADLEASSRLGEDATRGDGG